MDSMLKSKKRARESVNLFGSKLVKSIPLEKEIPY